MRGLAVFSGVDLRLRSSGRYACCKGVVLGVTPRDGVTSRHAPGVLLEWVWGWGQGGRGAAAVNLGERSGVHHYRSASRGRGGRGQPGGQAARRN